MKIKQNSTAFNPLWTRYWINKYVYELIFHRFLIEFNVCFTIVRLHSMPTTRI